MKYERDLERVGLAFLKALFPLERAAVGGQ
jgi:hypothetical protein